MRNWKDVPGRREAIVEFCEFMEADENAEKRTRCCAESEYAKEQFALVCGYYIEGKTLPGQPPNDSNLSSIPAAAEFRMFNYEDPKKDNLVTIVFPERGKAAEPEEVWRCTWAPWLGLVE